MRAATVTLTAFALTCLTGAQCQWLRTDKDRPPNVPAGTAPLEEYTAPRFVAYLNQQAGYLQSVRYDKVSLKASEAGNDMPRLGEGELVCSQPRNFRLTAGHILTSGSEIDLGSNNAEFWMYVKRAEQFVYCSHDDFSRGKANLPFPFDTDWVIQALGMKTYDTAAVYTSDVDQKTRTYTLSWDAKTPQGDPVHKVVVFAGDRSYADHPQVLKHVVMDVNRTVIASATIKEVKVVPAAGDPGKTVQVPTHVVLEWPQQKFKMDLELSRVRANEAMTPQETAMFFDRPKISGTSPVNLANAQFRPSSYRGASPDAPRPRAFGGR